MTRCYVSDLTDALEEFMGGGAGAFPAPVGKDVTEAARNSSYDESAMIARLLSARERDE